MANAQVVFPSVEETLKHPAYATAAWALEADRKGIVTVAKDRGGPVDIAWEIHGSGPMKVVLIMGLAGTKTSWQRQTKHFGHDNGKAYSVLILDNRGIGHSSKPLGRYTTTSMAHDTIELLDHVGWTAARQVNVVGISLGGMIAQEVACAVPERLMSLSLVCTSAALQSEKGLAERIADRAGMLMPKSQERAVEDTAGQIFRADWLSASDAEDLPLPGKTPKCGPAEGTLHGKYLLFDNNFQRFQAQELSKRRAPGVFMLKGFLGQLVAAGWHHKSAEQLRAMADALGRERILVMHGTADNMIPAPNGRALIEMIQPGVGLIEEGMGHAPIMERRAWFNDLLEERFGVWGKL